MYKINKRSTESSIHLKGGCGKGALEMSVLSGLLAGNYKLRPLLLLRACPCPRPKEAEVLHLSPPSNLGFFPSYCECVDCPPSALWTHSPHFSTPVSAPGADLYDITGSQAPWLPLAFSLALRAVERGEWGQGFYSLGSLPARSPWASRVLWLKGLLRFYRACPLSSDNPSSLLPLQALW